MRWALKMALHEAGEPAWRIAMTVGIRPDYLSRITSGAAVPPLEARRRICAYLHRTHQELFGDLTEASGRAGHAA